MRSADSTSRAAGLGLETRRDVVGREVDAARLVGVAPQHVVDLFDERALRIRALDEKLVGEAIGKRVQQIAAGRLAVAAGAAGFLVVRLERAGHGVVDDEAHVRLVDPHAEGVGRDDGAHLLAS